MTESNGRRQSGNLLPATILGASLIVAAWMAFPTQPRFTLVNDRGLTVWRIDSDTGTVCRTRPAWGGWDCVPESPWDAERQGKTEVRKARADEARRERLRLKEERIRAASDAAERQAAKERSMEYMVFAEQKLLEFYSAEFKAFLTRMHLRNSPSAEHMFLANESRGDGAAYSQILTTLHQSLVEDSKTNWAFLERALRGQSTSNVGKESVNGETTNFGTEMAKLREHRDHGQRDSP